MSRSLSVPDFRLETRAQGDKAAPWGVIDFAWTASQVARSLARMRAAHPDMEFQSVPNRSQVTIEQAPTPTLDPKAIILTPRAYHEIEKDLVAAVGAERALKILSPLMVDPVNREEKAKGAEITPVSAEEKLPPVVVIGDRLRDRNTGDILTVTALTERGFAWQCLEHPTQQTGEIKAEHLHYFERVEASASERAAENAPVAEAPPAEIPPAPIAPHLSVAPATVESSSPSPDAAAVAAEASTAAAAAPAAAIPPQPVEAPAASKAARKRPSPRPVSAPTSRASARPAITAKSSGAAKAPARSNKTPPSKRSR